MAAQELGFSPHTWVDCVIKRMIDSISGRGGTEALCTFFDQIDWVPELMPLTQNIKTQSIFFETALAKCNKELLKRPVFVRQDEVFQMLNNASLSVEGYIGEIERLVNDGIHGFMPEVLLMVVAYDRLADAYCSTYSGLKLVIDKTAETFGWGTFAIHSTQVRDYMDRYFLGYLAGEQKIPREEKEILQFIVRGNLARIAIDKAAELIKLGIAVVKWGFIYEVLGAAGALKLYEKARFDYSTPYNQANMLIRLDMAEVYGVQHKPKIRIRTGQAGGYYPPCLVMPSGTWEAGSITQDIVLEPLYRLPIFPKADLGSLQAIYAPLGQGKTILLSGIANYAILNKHELIFSPLNDKSDSFSLACIPMFAFNKRTQNLINSLKMLHVEPQGIPTLTLTFLRKGERFPDPEAHPPTIYDRIVRINNTKSFDLDFKLVVNTLKEIAEKYGYSKAIGLINVRNLDRGDLTTNTNVDVQVATQLLWHFDRWRKGHLTDPARISIDEISYLAPSTLNLFASDTQKSGATISDFIKESRRNFVSCDVGTQLPLEIINEIRTGATNVFFRKLATSKDKTRSQIDFLLECLQLEDPSMRNVVRDMNNRGVLPPHFWFWFNLESKRIRVIRPCPPTFALKDYKATPAKLLKLYEKHGGEKVLYDSWSDVPVLASTEEAVMAPKSSEKVLF